MARKTKYDLSENWEDPYDSARREEEITARGEQREATRIRSRLKILIGVSTPEHRHPLAGPGLVHDISARGVYCVTKHRLNPGDQVQIKISTRMCPSGLELPRNFYGGGKVMRVEPAGDDRVNAAIAFHDTLSESIEFARFINYLKTAKLDESYF